MASRGKGRNAQQVYDGSFYDLCRRFMESEKFKGFAEGTQSLGRRELAFACAPNCLGQLSLTEIRPALVQGYLDGWSDKPGKQQNALRALQAVQKWAIVRDFLPRPITLGVETGRPDGGHLPWTDAQVEHGEKYARDDFARVITLGAATGQRISDMVRMGWGDIRVIKGQPGIDVRQKKTGIKTWVIIDEKLAEAMATWERQPGPILRRQDGGTWESKNLTLGWRHEKDRNPDLAEHKRLGLVLHGLRGHCCVRLSRVGLNDHQIHDMLGMSIENVARYTRLSAQEENALAAVAQIHRLYPHKPLKIKDA
jgi:integrase